jgi:pre-60S factor REI1
MAGEQVKFTCLNCRVGFPTAVAQRLHYKTDWHRYNLKRKVRPPL